MLPGGLISQYTRTCALLPSRRWRGLVSNKRICARCGVPYQVEVMGYRWVPLTHTPTQPMSKVTWCFSTSVTTLSTCGREMATRTLTSPTSSNSPICSSCTTFSRELSSRTNWPMDGPSSESQSSKAPNSIASSITLGRGFLRVTTRSRPTSSAMESANILRSGNPGDVAERSVLIPNSPRRTAAIAAVLPDCKTAVIFRWWQANHPPKAGPSARGDGDRKRLDRCGLELPLQICR
jgi:hypothetical protein